MCLQKYCYFHPPTHPPQKKKLKCFVVCFVVWLVVFLGFCVCLVFFLINAIQDHLNIPITIKGSVASRLQLLFSLTAKLEEGGLFQKLKMLCLLLLSEISSEPAHSHSLTET